MLSAALRAMHGGLHACRAGTPGGRFLPGSRAEAWVSIAGAVRMLSREQARRQPTSRCSGRPTAEQERERDIRA